MSKLQSIVRYRETAIERLARWLYTVLLSLLYPIMPLYLRKRARKQPEYAHDWAQRFLGATGLPPATGLRFWVHAVSVGETHAIAPLVNAWAARFPHAEWVFTSTTPTGRETARLVFRDIARKHHVYLPYDLPFAVNRFYRELDARMGWLVETELWPNLIASAPGHGVQLCLLNARVSPRTGEQLLRWPALSRPALSGLAAVVAQTPADADWFERLGRTPDAVAGNLKFDVQPKKELLELGRNWRARWGSAPVLLAASTREGEEPDLLNAWQVAQAAWIEARGEAGSGADHAEAPLALPRLLVVPRHPQRFEEVASLFEAGGFFVSRRSAGFPDAPAGDSRPQVWLGDSMGEMPAYYASADIAFMGGSWQPLGGQNLIEACACDCPVLLGPHTFNFAKASEDALQASAALRFDTIGQAVDWAHDHLKTGVDFSYLRKAAADYAAAHRGAASRTVAVLATLSIE